MGRKFDVEYDDFSGGYFVGSNANKQPMNTWEGTDLSVAPDSGYLVPHTQMAKSAFSPMASAPLGMVTDGYGTFFWGRNTTNYVCDWATATPSTVAHVGYNSDPQLGQMVFFNGSTIRTTNGANLLVDATAVATTSQLTILGTYKYWVVAAGLAANTNRMRYCDANTPTSWPTANYYDVGPPGTSITGFAAGLDGLYVATTAGLYVVTGVFGATTNIRQVNDEHLETAVMWGNSVNGLSYQRSAFSRGLPATCVGSSVRKFLYPAVACKEIARSGSAVALLDYSNKMWVNDLTTTGAWMVRDFLLNTTLVPMEAGSDYAYALQLPGSASASLYRFPVNPTTAEVNPTGTSFAGFYAEVTATLAEYMARQPFRVREAIMEVRTGAGTTTTERAFSCKVLASGVLGEGYTPPTTFSSNASRQHRQAFTSTTAGARLSHRFMVDDAGPSFTVQPQLTLKGVDLIRLILRCEEV